MRELNSKNQKNNNKNNEFGRIDSQTFLFTFVEKSMVIFSCYLKRTQHVC